MARKTQADVMGHRVTFNNRFQTKPENRDPYSPEAIQGFYKKSRVGLNTEGGDGLSGKAHHGADVRIQRPQDLGDPTTNGRMKNYDNDVPQGSWLRGGGKQGAGHIDFDHVGNPKPNKGGGKCTASGQDATKSPFSSAYRRGEGF
jgi:hypothetical protein